MVSAGNSSSALGVERQAILPKLDREFLIQLLRKQCPEFSGLLITPIESGWDNAVFRLSNGLVARIPRTAAAGELLAQEQAWLPRLAPQLPLPIPRLAFSGRPSADLAWPWCVNYWLPGDSLLAGPKPPQARDQLVAFLRALHHISPRGAPINPVRGGPLLGRDHAVAQRLSVLDPELPTTKLRCIWRDLAHTPGWTGRHTLIHGDLHPGNILATPAGISGIIDFGDVTAGDPATDLAVAWALFDDVERAAFRADLSVSDYRWRRAAGWALNFALAYCVAGAHSLLYPVGRRILTEIIHEFG